MFNAPHKASPVLIKSVNISASGTYLDMTRSSYRANLNGNAINDIHAATQGFTEINAANLAGIASSVVQNHSHLENINITNGWASPRFTFTLIAETIHQGVPTTHMVSGYTDSNEISNGFTDLPPEAAFFISTIESVAQAPNGNAIISSSGHLLAPDVNPNSNQYLVRPSDVLRSGAQVASDPDMMMQMYQENDVKDLRYLVTSRMATSTDNASHSNYLAKLVNGAANSASALIDDGSDIGEVCLSVSAAGTQVENQVLSNPFIRLLQSRLPGYQSNMENGTAESFQWSDLHEVTAAAGVHLGDITTVYMPSNFDTVSIANREQQGNNTGQWGGGTIEERVARIVIDELPCIMTRVGLGSCTMVGNYNIPGLETLSVQVAAQRSASFMNEQYVMTSCMKSELLIRNSILATISNVEGIMQAGLSVTYVRDKRLMMTIVVNGQPPKMYDVPMYSRNLMSPVLTTDNNTINNLAVFTNNLVQAVASSKPYFIQ